MAIINPNAWHSYPRYGLAAALVAQKDRGNSLTSTIELVKIAANSLENCLERYLLHAQGSPEADATISYAYVDGATLNPGGASGQNSKNGYFLAPHVLTSSDSAKAVIEVKKLIGLLRLKNIDPVKPYELKRSFAPMITKLNNGNPSMSNPRTGLLEAAFSAVATLTQLKPAAYLPYKKGEFANFGIIPDLPFWDGADQNNRPLIEFIELFENLSGTYEADKLEGKVNLIQKAFPRPKLFDGNYPGASKNNALGSVSLSGAIGRWARQARLFKGAPRSEWADKVLNYLAERPLYIVSYEVIRQEFFSHYLVNLTLREDLDSITQAINRTRLLGTDNYQKYTDPKWQTFKLMADRLLRLYTPPAFRDFLAYRTEYPYELTPLIEHYMINQSPTLTYELVKSARAYGESLNLAAYLAAKEEQEDDKRGRTGRTLAEYKDRILTQLESTIHSAKSGTALLSQLGTIAGRLTRRDIKPEAALFMEAVAAGEISNEKAKELITAFMRLSTYKSKINETPDLATVDDEDTNDSETSTQA